MYRYKQCDYKQGGILLLINNTYGYENCPVQRLGLLGAVLIVSPWFISFLNHSQDV